MSVFTPRTTNTFDLVPKVDVYVDGVKPSPVPD